jgi:hypothetical protein
MLDELASGLTAKTPRLLNYLKLQNICQIVSRQEPGKAKEIGCLLRKYRRLTGRIL